MLFSIICLANLNSIKMMSKKEISIIIAIVSGIIISRLLPHAPNFTAAIAGFIFGGVVLKQIKFGSLLLICYFFADLLLNNFILNPFSGTMIWFKLSSLWIYVPLILVFLLSNRFKQLESQPFKIINMSLLSSMLFFLISNFGVWTVDTLYAKDLMGLLTCYWAAIPFFGNELAGTLFYTSLYFGVYWLSASYSKTRSVRL